MINDGLILVKDFNQVYRKFEEFDKLQNSSIMITGCTGFLGSLIIKFFLYLNEIHHTNILILAYVRNLDKAHKMFANDNGIKFIEGDLEHLDVNLFKDFSIDYIFHCAAITKSAEMIVHPVEVLTGIVEGTKNVLILAHQKQVKSMVYLSSMEVYGATDLKLEKITEMDLGQIDLFNPRSCYPLGKRTAENLCYNYYKEYGVSVKIARLAQTFGAGILQEENRIFAQFVKCARYSESIVLHTKGDSVGNYCYTADALQALLLLLIQGKDGETYNVVNEASTMTILEMAQLVANKVTNRKIKVEFDIPHENSYGYAAKTTMRLSSAKLQQLNWQPTVGMEETYRRMIAYMDECGMI